MPRRTQVLAFALLATAGCSRPAAAPAPTDGGPALVLRAEMREPSPHEPGTGPLQFIPQRFEELYPWLLVRRSMARGDKARLWQRDLEGRWVRWHGAVQSITPNGITLKHFSTTTTFDVSLWLDAEQLKMLRKLGIHRGDRVTYIGQLKDYDDIFRHVQLTHGALVAEKDTNVGPVGPLPPAPVIAPPAHDAGAPEDDRPPTIPGL